MEFYLALLFSAAIVLEPLIMFFLTYKVYDDSRIKKLSCNKPDPPDEESPSSKEGSAAESQQVRCKRGVGSPNDFE